MKPVLTTVLLLCACRGPTQQQVTKAPTATLKPRVAEAPPASGNDRDRERAIQQFEDMNDTRRAYREAEQERDAPPPTTMFGAPETP